MSAPSKYEGLWPIRRTGSSDNERKQVNNLFKLILNDLSPSTSVDLAALEDRIVALENGDADLGDAVFNLGGVDTFEAGDIADRPAANEFGAWYFATDERKLYRDDGSSWKLVLSIDHTDLENIGTNTHPQIDTHIASTSNPHQVTLEQARTQNQLMSGDFDLSAIAVPSAPSASTARVFAFDQNGETRLKFIDPDGVATDLSQDNNFVVRNTSGATINAGQAVYVTAQTGVVPDVSLAKSDSAATMPSIGIMAEDVANNDFGKCVKVGIIENIDTSALSVNDLLYVSETTAGSLTNTKPAHPHLNQHVARVLVSSIGSGSIAVNILDIDGESLGTQQNNYRVGDGTAGNKTIDLVGSSVSTITWDGTDITIPDLVITESQISDLGNYALVGHTHTLSDVTDSGTAAAADTGTTAGDVPVRETDTTAILVSTFIDESTGYLCALYSDGAIEILASDGSELLNGYSGVFDPRITFTRNDAAKYWNSSGVLTEAAVDEARLDYDPSDDSVKGWLLEPERTNDLLDPRDLSTGNWSGGATVTQNETGIDGAANTAWTAEDTSTSSLQSFQQQITVPDDSNTHQGTRYIKKTSGATVFPRLVFDINGGTSVRSQWFLNTNDGTIVGVPGLAGDGSASVRDVGDFWEVLISVTNNSTGNTSLNYFNYVAATDDMSTSDSSLLGSIVYDYGQVELNAAYATSPIEGGSSAVTRVADDASMTGTDFSALWNDSEGTPVIEVIPQSTEDGTILSINDGTANEVIILEIASGNYQARIVDGGTTQATITGGAVTGGTAARLALAYKANDIAFYQDGSEQGTDTSATIPTVTQMEWGTGFHVAYAGYAPSCLPNYLLGGVSKPRTTEYPRFSIPVVKDGEMFVGGDASFTGQLYKTVAPYVHDTVTSTQTLTLDPAAHTQTVEITTSGITLTVAVPNEADQKSRQLVLYAYNNSGNSVLIDPVGRIDGSGGLTLGDGATGVIGVFYDGNRGYIQIETDATGDQRP